MIGKKITIFGCCGSGKTYLSLQIHKITKIPLIHLDSLNWSENWIPVEEERFNYLLENEINKDKWIIEGLYNRTVDLRISFSDTIIYLDYSRKVCFFNIIKRWIKNHGKNREGMPNNCKEHIDFPFLKCVWNYNRNYRLKYLKMLNKTDDKEIIILKSRRDCKSFLSRLEKEFN